MRQHIWTEGGIFNDRSVVAIAPLSEKLVDFLELYLDIKVFDNVYGEMHARSALSSSNARESFSRSVACGQTTRTQGAPTNKSTTQSWQVSNNLDIAVLKWNWAKGTTGNSLQPFRANTAL